MLPLYPSNVCVGRCFAEHPANHPLLVLVGYRTWVIWGQGYLMAAFLIIMFLIMTVITVLALSIHTVISVGGKGRHVLRLKLSLMLFAGVNRSIISQNGLCISMMPGNQSILFLFLEI